VREKKSFYYETSEKRYYERLIQALLGVKLTLELKEALRQNLANLEPRLHLVLESRYARGASLRKIGEELGVTVERVRQLEFKGLLRLRCALWNNPAFKDLCCPIKGGYGKGGDEMGKQVIYICTRCGAEEVGPAGICPEDWWELPLKEGFVQLCPKCVEALKSFLKGGSH